MKKLTSLSFIVLQTFLLVVILAGNVYAIDSDGDGIDNTIDLDDDNDGINDDNDTSFNFQYATYSNITSNTAVGTVNGVGFTYSSTANFSTTSSVFSHNTFPASFNVPNVNPTIRNDNITTGTLTFASPVLNPVLVFASIGNGSNGVPIQFSDPFEVLFSTGVTINSATQVTGQEGYLIIRIRGLFSSLSFSYTQAESYCNFVFGAAFPTGGDTDGDGLADRLDLDSDNDGISDLVESGQNAALVDVNGNGILDSMSNPSTADVNSNGLADSVESSNLVYPLNSDSDEIPDFQDLDSDNDRIPDIIEAHPSANYVATYGNDGDVTNDDVDLDGVISVFDSNDNLGGSALFGGTFIAPVNTDGADNPDYLDTDSDNDSLLDSSESGLSSGTDTNNDGIIDSVGASYPDPDGNVNDPLGGTLTNSDANPTDADYRSLNVAPTPTPIPTSTPTATPTPTVTPTPSIPPPVVGTPPAGQESITDPLPIITGSAIPGAEVEVYIDNVLVGKTTANQSGVWTLKITTPLTPGKKDVKSFQTFNNLRSEVSNTTQLNIITLPLLDFDGDGVTDFTAHTIASDSVRYRWISSRTNTREGAIVKGTYQVPADYLANGKTQPAAIENKDGTLVWNILDPATGTSYSINHGTAGNVVLAGCRLVQNDRSALVAIKGGQLSARNMDGTLSVSIRNRIFASNDIVGCGDLNQDGLDEIILRSKGRKRKISSVTAGGVVTQLKNTRRRAWLKTVRRPGYKTIPLISSSVGISEKRRIIDVIAPVGDYSHPGIRSSSRVNITAGFFRNDSGDQISGIFWSTSGKKVVKRKLLTDQAKTLDVFKLLGSEVLTRSFNSLEAE